LWAVSWDARVFRGDFEDGGGGGGGGGGAGAGAGAGAVGDNNNNARPEHHLQYLLLQFSFVEKFFYDRQFIKATSRRIIDGKSIAFVCSCN
jgi:hypothetical protein